MSGMGRAIGLIAAERARQDVKWGEQNHSPELWYAILGEEFGEVGKAICERAAELGRGYDIVASAHADEIRDELVQVAAVAVAMLESLERNESVTLNSESESLIGTAHTFPPCHDCGVNPADLPSNLCRPCLEQRR